MPKERIDYQGQLLSKEQVIEMFSDPDYGVEVIISDEPPYGDDEIRSPVQLSNWKVYLCTDKDNEIDNDDSEDKEPSRYWFVAVEDKNPTVEFTIDYIDEEFNKTEDDNKTE
jgi:hypothetical protein